MPRSDKDIPLPRALGRFFGHLWNAAAKPPPDSEKRTVSESTETADAEIDGRPVTLRRTIIEEVEFKDRPRPGDGPNK